MQEDEKNEDERRDPGLDEAPAGVPETDDQPAGAPETADEEVEPEGGGATDTDGTPDASGVSA